MDTIFAEATPPGKGGVSIVRLSGPQAHAIAAALVGPLPEARQAVLRDIVDHGERIDSALIVNFAAGHSFTGDDVVEFHLHGAPVVVRRLAEALRRAGARPAGAGEFTRRAFLAGRIDLTQVQGLSDLLAAETEAQRQLAMRNAGGELGRLGEGWRARLVEAAALLTAAADFPDEDTGDALEETAARLVAGVHEEIEATLRGAQAAEIVREGFTIAILGPPNAGKSTLLNALVRREVAIVTDRPGTTRDLIEVHLDIGGYAVTLIDTAGLRETSDEIEREGIARARAAARRADLRLHLSEDATPDPESFVGGDLVVRAKADAGGAGLAVSGKTGAGIDALLERIATELSTRVAGAGVVSHRTQVDALSRAADALRSAETAPVELAAEFLARALRELEALLGRVDIEDHLDLIFSRFCIGK